MEDLEVVLVQSRCWVEPAAVELEPEEEGEAEAVEEAAKEAEVEEAAGQAVERLPLLVDAP